MLFSLFSPYVGATPEVDSTSQNLPDSSTTVTSATYATYEMPVEVPSTYAEPTNAVTTTDATYADGEYLIDYKPLRKTVSGNTRDSSFKTNYTYPGDLIIKDGKYHFSFKFAETQGLSKFLVEHFPQK
jgi:hypothetical protein